MGGGLTPNWLACRWRPISGQGPNKLQPWLVCLAVTPAGEKRSTANLSLKGRVLGYQACLFGDRVGFRGARYARFHQEPR